MKHKSYTNPADDMELSALLQYAARLMRRRQHSHPHAHRGQHAQGKVLSILIENGPMSQAELLEILDVRSSSLSELLAKLERNGMISRERNEADRRSFIVSATDAAQTLLSERTNDHENNADKIFAALNIKEKEELHRLLLKVVTSIKDEDEPGPGRGRGCHHNEHGPGHGPGRGRRTGMRGGRGRRR